MHPSKTAGRIEVKLGTGLGLGKCHNVLSGDPGPPREGANGGGVFWTIVNYRNIDTQIS